MPEVTSACMNGHKHYVRLNGCADVNSCVQACAKKSDNSDAIVLRCEKCDAVIMANVGGKRMMLGEFISRAVENGASGVGFQILDADHLMARGSKNA